MQVQLTLDDCKGFEVVSKQRTLDGKSLYQVSDADFVGIVDQFARRNSQSFAEYCSKEGIAYHGKSSVTRTLLCCRDLEKHFGFFTTSMLEALERYPVED